MTDSRRGWTLARLAEHPDLARRPCAELASVAVGDELDPPIVPLLNALWALGLRTQSSCAGHGKIGEAHVALEVAGARGLAALRMIAATLPGSRLALGLISGSPLQATVFWGCDRVYTEAELDDLCARAVRVVQEHAAQLPADGVSDEERFARELVDQLAQADPDVPNGTLWVCGMCEHGEDVRVCHCERDARWRVDVTASAPQQQENGEIEYVPLYSVGASCASWSEVQQRLRRVLRMLS